MASMAAYLDTASLAGAAADQKDVSCPEGVPDIDPLIIVATCRRGDNPAQEPCQCSSHKCSTALIRKAPSIGAVTVVLDQCSRPFDSKAQNPEKPVQCTDCRLPAL